jgi:hypothetical protein
MQPGSHAFAFESRYTADSKQSQHATIQYSKKGNQFKKCLISYIHEK